MIAAMGTSWEKIETSAMIYIKNDVNLDWNLQNRLPVFYNTMASYMKSAIPKFNRPPEMVIRLKSYTEPEFTDEVYTADDDYTAGTEIDVEVTGYDICCAGVITMDEYDDPSYQSIAVTSYNSTTGKVKLSEDISEGTEIQLDFYKSGSFDIDLNDTEIDILAFCIYDVWEHRFDNNALERASKVRDNTFTTISEASQTAAGTNRQKEVDSQLFAMMRAYADNLEYLSIVKGTDLI